MFSSLHQGSTIYILEKSSTPTLKVGQILNVSQPLYNNFNTAIDLNVKVGDETLSFKSVPGTLQVVNYNDAIITETRELMVSELETMLQNSRAIIESMDSHNSIINSCEQILRQLNPKYAKQQELDEDIHNLKSKISGIEEKMDTILTLLNKNS